MMLESSQSLLSLPACCLQKGLCCVGGFWAGGIDRAALEDFPSWHKEAQKWGETLSPLSTDFIQVFGVQINKNGINNYNPTKPVKSKI